MKILILNVLLVISILSAKSENLHTPAELMKMMIDSKMTYSLNIDDSLIIDCKDYSQKLNFHEFYRVEKNNEIITYEYKYGNEDKDLLEKAEHAFRYNILDSALYYYDKVLKANPSLFNVMTYMGQVYGIKKEHKKAIEWYKNAIDNNYIDYMAHWFLADIYYDMEEYEKAKDEIVIAHILNRNNSRIMQSLKRILNKLDYKYSEWCFNPQYNLMKKSDTEISINAKPKWLMYANFKAFWQYEPDYKKSMGGSEHSFSTTEEIECLLPIVLIMEKKMEDYKGDLQFEALYEASQNKYIKEYILFEIFLPPVPSAAYQFSKETILEIKDYVLKTRIKKI